MDTAVTLHVIEDDLSEGWLIELAGSGVEAVDGYLARYLALLGYLDDDATSRRA